MHPMDYEVDVVQNAAEAIGKVRTKAMNLVILDVMMLDLNCVWVCERLKKRVETFDLPVIMFSILSQVSDKVRCLKAGADECITCPLRQEQSPERNGEVPPG